MEMELKGKRVVITGGSTGIGKAVAKAFLEEGAQVMVCGRKEDKLLAAKSEFQALGLHLETKVADVSQKEELEALGAVAAAEFGGIDIWINNAGGNFRKPFDQAEEKEWQQLVNTDFKSVYFGTAVAASYMKRSGGGVVINTSSFTSLVPTGGLALYSAMKAAVNNFTRTAAAELAADHIRVVAIIPGYIETELTAANVAANFESLVANIPMRRLGKPEDMVPAYLFLASDAASYINGICLPVSGAKLATQNPAWCWQNR